MPPARASGDEIRRLIARQLRRTPSIPFVVEVSCAYGWPAVIRSSPFDAGGNPNPNLYYLSCPYLRRLLARMEDTGFIESLQRRARENPSVAEALAEANETHAREWEAEAGTPVDAASPGPRIAAAANVLSIKCLHAHFAYFLVHPDYLVGKMIADELEEIWCADERCRGLVEHLGDESWQGKTP